MHKEEHFQLHKEKEKTKKKRSDFKQLGRLKRNKGPIKKKEKRKNTNTKNGREIEKEHCPASFSLCVFFSFVLDVSFNFVLTRLLFRKSSG